MNADQDNVTSLAAARKAKQAAARKASAAGRKGPAETSVKSQVWFFLAAVACAYLVYSYFAGAGQP